MAKINDILIPSLTLEEILSDGSTLTNPAADHRRLFLGEDGYLHLRDSAGTVTDTVPAASGIPATIFDAQGDIIVASAADTAARLAKGAAGTVPTAGASTIAYAYPPGYEYAYAQITSDVTVTSTTTGDSVVSAGAVTFDGSTDIYVEFYCPSAQAANDAAGRLLYVFLYDGAQLGHLALISGASTTADRNCIMARRKLTPSNGSHTYAIRAIVSAGTGFIRAGDGSSSAYMPAYVRVVKA